jgi:hypothetical protein
VESVTESGKVKGEDLLGSQRLKVRFTAAKKRLHVGKKASSVKSKFSLTGTFCQGKHVSLGDAYRVKL